MNSSDYSAPDPSFKEDIVAAPKLRFVQVKFSDRQNSKVYTYRVDPDVEVLVGQYAVTRRNMSKVIVVAIDTAPVPNLDLSKYDFVDPVSVETGE
jgi:hypothetical protein